jgi:uncharacterized protein YecT (DUF1311 family)
MSRTLLIPALLLASGLALAGCSSTVTSAGPTTPTTASSPSAEPSDQPTTPTTPAAATTPSTAPTSSTSSLHYVKIVEPFSKPGPCKEDGNTLEMTACLLKQVQTADQRVDALQRKRFEQADPADQAGLLADDAKWLKQRHTTCAADRTGGTIDQINAAGCLLKGAQARAKTLAASA